MDIKADEISKIIREQIGSFAVDVDVAEVGSIISIGDGIARVHGVENAMAGEMLGDVEESTAPFGLGSGPSSLVAWSSSHCYDNESTPR